MKLADVDWFCFYHYCYIFAPLSSLQADGSVVFIQKWICSYVPFLFTGNLKQYSLSSESLIVKKLAIMAWPNMLVTTVSVPFLKIIFSILEYSIESKKLSLFISSSGVCKACFLIFEVSEFFNIRKLTVGCLRYISYLFK